MARAAALRAADFRAIARVTGECRDLGDDPMVWREHWFEQLGRLCGADLVVGGDTVTRPGGRVHGVEPVGWGWENGFDPSPVRRTMAEHGADLFIAPHIEEYFRRPASADGAGLARTDLIPDREWYRSAYFHSIQRGIGVDHTLLSFLAFPGRAGEGSCLTLARGSDSRRDFGPRDRALLREAHAWVVPLVGGPLARFAEPFPSQLPPRVRDVLRCVLEGDSDKQVAARLGISTLTVNQYTKHIYRHFGVRGRAELLARWVRRGWGSGRPGW
jgi:DNA-binding CsgD family transcriptional regulator